MTSFWLKFVCRRHFWHFSTLCMVGGFSVFAMFFGSGNLVFPLTIGKMASYAPFSATIGIICTGVLVPSLGLFGIIQSKGRIDVFFEKLGKREAFFFPLLILGLLGPFGVIPRCIAVAHASFELTIPDFPLLYFSLLFCLLTFFILSYPKRFIEIMGGVLTPLLLFTLGWIISAGLGQKPLILETHSSFLSLEAFLVGGMEGYQTMDLLAAFFFASSMRYLLHQKLENTPFTSSKKESLVLWSLGMGGGLLALVYGCLVYLSAHFSSLLESVPPEKYLGTIAYACLGPKAGLILSLLVILACLTTAVALTQIVTHFTREKIFNHKLSFPLTLSLILVLTVGMSLFRFKGLIIFLEPILKVLYPSLILYCLLTLFFPRLSPRVVRVLFYVMLFFMILFLGIGMWT